MELNKIQQAIKKEIDQQMEYSDNATIYLDEKAKELKTTAAKLGEEIINFCRAKGYDCTYASDVSENVPKKQQHSPRHRINKRFAIEPGKQFNYDKRADN